MKCGTAVAASLALLTVLTALNLRSIPSVPFPRIPASRPRAPRRQFAHRPAPPLPSRARVCGVVFVFVLASARTCRCVRTLCLPQSTPNTKQTRTRTRTRTHANCFPDGNIVSKS